MISSAIHIFTLVSFVIGEPMRYDIWLTPEAKKGLGMRLDKVITMTSNYTRNKKNHFSFGRNLNTASDRPKDQGFFVQCVGLSTREEHVPEIKSAFNYTHDCPRPKFYILGLVDFSEIR